MKEEIKKYRKVDKTTVTVNNTKVNDKDNSANLQQFIVGELSYVTESGIPKIINIQFIKNSNTTVTKDNSVINIEIPLIPSTYDFSSVDNLRRDFFFNGMPEIAVERYEQIMKNQEAKENLNRYMFKHAETIASYVCTELNRKLKSLGQSSDLKDRNTIDFIKNLSCMKEHNQAHGNSFLKPERSSIMYWMTQMIKDYENAKPQGQPTGGQPGDGSN